MSSRTPNQEKALRWFVESNNLKPQLSAHPVYYFVDKQGKEQSHNIIHILMNWQEQRKTKKEKP